MKNLSTKYRGHKEYVTMNLESFFHNKLVYNIIIYYLYTKIIEINDTLFILDSLYTNIRLFKKLTKL